MLLLFYLIDVRGSSDLKDLSGIYSIHMTIISAVPLLKYFEYLKYLNIFSFINHIFLSDSVVLRSNFKNSDVRTFKSVLHVSTRVLCERILGEVDDDLLGEGM